jgi:hypothetical protein
MTETIENLPVVSREPELIESMRGAKSGSCYSLDLVIPSREIHGDTKERIMRLGAHSNISLLRIVSCSNYL